MWIFPLLTILTAVAANTETYLFSIPNYYNIPDHPESAGSGNVQRVNETTLVLHEHPVFSIDNYHPEKAVVKVPYDFGEQPPQRLLVKVNNYENRAFSSNDVVNVKLCWPATSPIDFRLSHRFIRQQEFGPGFKSGGRDTLDIYVVVDFAGHFFSVSETQDTHIDVFLAISRLPNRLPIPIELYDYIVYLVDLVILTWWVLPQVISSIA